MCLQKWNQQCRPTFYWQYQSFRRELSQIDPEKNIGKFSDSVGNVFGYNRKSGLQWFKEIEVDVCLMSGPEVGSLELTQQLNYVIKNPVLSFFLLCHLYNVAFLLSC